MIPTKAADDLVRAGLLPQSMSASSLARLVSEELNANVRYVDGGKVIETAAVCGGSGGDLYADIAEAGIDALITGDVSYHDFLGAKQAGVTLIAAGHFQTENPVVEYLADKLRARFPQTDIIVLSEDDPIEHISID